MRPNLSAVDDLSFDSGLGVFVACGPRLGGEVGEHADAGTARIPRPFVAVR